jgi:hypothetical protein
MHKIQETESNVLGRTFPGTKSWNNDIRLQARHAANSFHWTCALAECRKESLLNTPLVKATLVGALGGLLFRFDTAVIAGTTQSLTLVYGLTPAALGLTVSIALWGTVVGAMTAGIIGQRFGGRETLRILAIFFMSSPRSAALSRSTGRC